MARRDETPEVPISARIEAPTILTVSEHAGPRESGFPDLRGLSAREAVRSLARLGLTARLHGAGIVIDQLPAPGEPIDGRGSCELWLGRLVDAPRAGTTTKVSNGTNP